MQELNKIEEEALTQASVEQLPISIIQEKLKEKGIVYKSTDKKKDLIKALLIGESTIKKVEKKAAPRLEDTETPQALPIISEALREELDKLVAKGLKYELDVASSCLNFSGFDGRLTACANIDQSINNILSAARSVIGKISFGIETNNSKDLW